ncbi:MAG: baseplate J/gp47 family protein, partial [Anaerolineaceae bacterium]|nr:baseplate J/gp47 family protein [Anaerolineaceae bacterium]
MKTNVIQLEVHDDVISIKDKMAWQSCQRMILVWPKHGKILHNELEMVLLNREAKSLGAELALVTHHPVVREWALDSNVPLFASISAAEKGAWKIDGQGSLVNKVPKGVDTIRSIRAKLPHVASIKPANPLINGLAVLLSLMAVIALLVFLLPQAEVIYTPATTQQAVEIRIKASEVLTGINPSGNIPAKAVFIEVSGEKAKPSTGKVSIPTTKAVGEVVFTNLTSADVTLSAGSLFLAGEQNLVSFSLTEALVVPARVNDSVTGKVEALIAGVEGNLAADSTWVLPGGMDGMVSVSNPDEFSGGGGVETPSPNDEDYALLERLLLADLMNQGLASFKAEQSEG